LHLDDLQRERIRKQLLVTPGITRRTSWAGGFYLGHSSPKTTLHSYIHFVGDWADQLLELPGGLPEAPPDQAFVPDDLPPLAPVDTRLLSNITPPLEPICARPGKAKQPILLDRIQKGGSEEYQVKKRFAAILTRNQSG